MLALIYAQTAPSTASENPIFSFTKSEGTDRMGGSAVRVLYTKSLSTLLIHCSFFRKHSSITKYTVSKPKIPPFSKLGLSEYLTELIVDNDLVRDLSVPHLPFSAHYFLGLSVQ